MSQALQNAEKKQGILESQIERKQEKRQVDNQDAQKERLESTKDMGARSGKKRFANQLVGKIRHLTPKEFERLQGFPDDWTKYGVSENGETIEISDSRRYERLGEAVTVNVVEAIAKRLKRQ